MESLFIEQQSIETKKELLLNYLAIASVSLYLINLYAHLSLYSTTIAKLAKIMFFVGIVLYIVLRKGNWNYKLSGYHVWWGAFLLVSIVFTLRAGTLFSSSFWQLVADQKNIIASLLIFEAIRSKQNLYRVLGLTAIIAGVSAAVFLVNTYGWTLSGSLSYTWANRMPETLGDNPNVLGGMYAIAFVFGAFLLYKRKNFMYCLFLIPILIYILFTGSKRALLFLLLSIASLFILDLKSSFVVKLLKAFIIAILILILYNALMDIPLFYTVVGYRFEGMINSLTGQGSIDASTFERQMFISEGWELFLSAPFSGHGFYTFPYINTVAYGKYAHNNYIELLADMGVTGLVVYYALPIWLLKGLYAIYKKSDDESKNLSILLIILIMVTLITDIIFVSYMFPVTYVLFAVTAAFIKLYEGA